MEMMEIINTVAKLLQFQRYNQTRRHRLACNFVLWTRDVLTRKQLCHSPTSMHTNMEVAMHAAAFKLLLSITPPCTMLSIPSKQNSGSDWARQSVCWHGTTDAAQQCRDIPQRCLVNVSCLSSENTDHSERIEPITILT